MRIEAGAGSSAGATASAADGAAAAYIAGAGNIVMDELASRLRGSLLAVGVYWIDTCIQLYPISAAGANWPL